MALTTEQQKLHRRIMDTVSNIAFRVELPHQVHVLIQDSETGKRYGGFVGVEYNYGIAKLTRTGIGELREGKTLIDLVDKLLEASPGTP